jgi:hypothetical protein
MDGGTGERPGNGAGMAALLLALAVPLLVLAGVGGNAAVRHVFAPRPAYGAPPAVGTPLMAWDGRRNQVLMVTGPGGHPRRDASTWAWDGSGWIQHAGVYQPPLGSDFTAVTAYDESRRAAVAVVTNEDDRQLADTWEWTGTAWQQIAREQPVAVYLAALGYDEARRELVLVGIKTGAGGGLDTWVLRGSRWVAMPDAISGDEAWPYHLAFDHATNRLLFFPSAPAPPEKAPSCRGDCPLQVRPCPGCPVHPLAWNGSSWIPSGMSAPDGTVVADPTGKGLLDLVDGDTPARGLWRWDGQRWSRVASLPTPRSVWGWGVAPDPDAGQLVLYGGTETNGGWQPESKVIDQTWTFDGQSWTMRSGKPLPKLPPPSTPPPPLPCLGSRATLHAGPGNSGAVFAVIQLPISGPPGTCMAIAATLRLETATGQLLHVQGNPATLESAAGFGDLNATAYATWSNWCGRRTGLVMRLTGAGFDVTAPVPAPPLCTSGRSPSTLTLVRPMAIP